MAVDKENKEKVRLHIRNKNRERYDLEALIKAEPELAAHIKPSKSGEDSVDFESPLAVKLLNKALLSHYYGVKNWDFPDDNLCPPIPGRADYIHHMADLLTQSNFGILPVGEQITCLDVGVGANCIYPIIGVTEYGWNFIGSDVEQKSIDAANHIVMENPVLMNKVENKLQTDPKLFFDGIISSTDKVDLSICNPPFHSSIEEATKGSRRKVKNLSGKKKVRPVLNFAGISNELIYEGGEHTFIHNMILESKNFADNVYWFSTLVSKKSNLKGIYRALSMEEATQVKTIPIGTGNKSSRIIAWSFLSKEDQKEWREKRWKEVTSES